MRSFTVLLILVLSGCANTVKLYGSENLKPHEIVKITTSCNKLCNSSIKNQLGFDDRYQRSNGLLLEIDGRQGKRKVRNGSAFNSSIDGSFNIEIKSGNHELVIDHNSYFLSGKPERFFVDLLGGHEYLIARIRVEYLKGPKYRMYRWFPLVFDVTDNQVTYANDRSFDESAKLTCANSKKSPTFCECFVRSLNQTLSYKDKEAMIMNKNSDLLELNFKKIDLCSNRKI